MPLFGMNSIQWNLRKVANVDQRFGQRLPELDDFHSGNAFRQLGETALLYELPGTQRWCARRGANSNGLVSMPVPFRWIARVKGNICIVGYGCPRRMSLKRKK